MNGADLLGQAPGSAVLEAVWRRDHHGEAGILRAGEKVRVGEGTAAGTLRLMKKMLQELKAGQLDREAEVRRFAKETAREIAHLQVLLAGEQKRGPMLLWQRNR